MLFAEFTLNFNKLGRNVSRSWNECKKHASYFSQDPRTFKDDLSKRREMIIQWRAVVSQKNTVVTHILTYLLHGAVSFLRS